MTGNLGVDILRRIIGEFVLILGRGNGQGRRTGGLFSPHKTIVLINIGEEGGRK